MVGGDVVDAVEDGPVDHFVVVDDPEGGLHAEFLRADGVAGVVHQPVHVVGDGIIALGLEVVRVLDEDAAVEEEDLGLRIDPVDLVGTPLAESGVLDLVLHAHPADRRDDLLRGEGLPLRLRLLLDFADELGFGVFLPFGEVFLEGRHL